jgi:hypothetical protein
MVKSMPEPTGHPWRLPSPDWDALWRELGRYDPDAAPADRDAESVQWAGWIRCTIAPS